MTATRLPKPTHYSLTPGGVGTMSSAELWNALRERYEWIEDALAPATGWCHPVNQDVAEIRQQGSIPINGGDGDRRSFGRFRCGEPCGDPNDVATFFVFMGNVGTANLTYYAEQPPDNEYSQQTLVTPGVTDDGVWLSGGLLIYTGRTYGIVAVGSGAFSQRPETIAVLTEPRTSSGGEVTLGDGLESVPVAWEKLAVTNHTIKDARPDDVHSFRRLQRQTGHLIWRAARTLMQHSLVEPIAADGETRTYRYLVRRSAGAAGMTVQIFCLASPSTAPIHVYLMERGGIPVEVAASVAGLVAPITTAAWVSCAITEAEFDTALASGGGVDPEQLYEIHVTATPIGGDSITVYDVCVYENAYTAADFLASGDSAPSRQYRGEVTRLRPGDPIVAAYTGSPTRYSDRKTLANNVLHAALYRSQIAVWDRIWRDSAVENLNAAEGISGGGSTAILARAKVLTAGGIAWTEIRLALWRHPSWATADDSQLGSDTAADKTKAVVTLSRDSDGVVDTVRTTLPVGGPIGYNVTLRASATAGSTQEWVIHAYWDTGDTVMDDAEQWDRQYIICSGAWLHQLPRRDGP